MAQLKHAAALLMSALREIFDEAPYSRFLARHRLPPSRQSYREFLRESLPRQERRPRCC